MRHIMIMLAICFAMVIGYQQTTPAMESHSVQEITVNLEIPYGYCIHVQLHLMWMFVR